MKKLLGFAAAASVTIWMATAAQPQSVQQPYEPRALPQTTEAAHGSVSSALCTSCTARPVPTAVEYTVPPARKKTGGSGSK
jgi:hypothetical protein